MRTFVAERMRAMIIMRLCLQPLSAAAVAGLNAAGLAVPTWFRFVTTAILVTGAYRMAKTRPAKAAVARFHDWHEQARTKFVRKWRANWKSYATIPFVAAFTGWLTNRIAVSMLFYPITFKGIPIWHQDGVPLGLVGWTGIVPAKCAAMASRMVDTLLKLIDLRVVFRRLDPARVTALLMPGVQVMIPDVIRGLVPTSADWLRGTAASLAGATFAGLPRDVKAQVTAQTQAFVAGVVRDMQHSIDSLIDLRGLVVGEMLRDRRLLVDLFQRVGRAELKFLVDSGFGFGFLLGVVQMVIWVLYDARWTLAVGGAAVGYLTNWVALKLIFEPVEPVVLCGLRVQGLFLRRQNEVADEFARCLVPATLTSEQLWGSILHGAKAANFRALLDRRTTQFVNGVAALLFGGPATDFAPASVWQETTTNLCDRVAEELPKHLHLVCPARDRQRSATAPG